MYSRAGPARPTSLLRGTKDANNNKATSHRTQTRQQQQRWRKRDEQVQKHGYYDDELRLPKLEYAQINKNNEGKIRRSFSLS